MAKFKVGEKVKIVRLLDKTINESYLGRQGVIETILTDRDAYDYDVSLGDDGEYNFDNFFEDELESAETSTVIKFARKNNDVILPSKRQEDGAFDIYANFEEDFIIINPHETKMIPTGLYSAFSRDYVAILKERGSTGSKGIGQRCGVIDSGYRGEWQVPITNHNEIPLVIAKTNYDKPTLNFSLTGNDEFTIEHMIYPYEKAISQVIMIEVPKLTIEETTLEELQAIKSERGNGMMGSSGK